MARRRAWSGRRKAAVTWRPIIVGEMVVCTAAIVATASDRHSADDESGCERVQGCLRRCGRGRVWSRREWLESLSFKELRRDGVEWRLLKVHVTSRFAARFGG